MTTRALEAIVGRAVVSERFRTGILSDKRAELIDPFDLDQDEKAAVMAIQAKSLVEFSAAIEKVTTSIKLFGRSQD